MKRSLGFALAVLLSATMTTGAFAGAKDFKGRADMETALTGLGVVANGPARAETAYNGRTDLAFNTNMTMAQIVAKVRVAYRTAKILPAKYRVKGHAKLDHRGSWSITMARGGYYSMVEVKPTATGSKIILVGAIYDTNTARRNAKRTSTVRK